METCREVINRLKDQIEILEKSLVACRCKGVKARLLRLADRAKQDADNQGKKAAHVPQKE